MRNSDTDALARLLEGSAPDGEAPEELHQLAALAQAMEARATAPRPDFRASLRETLLAEAAKPAPPTLLERARMAVDDRIARIRYSARAATATGVAAMTLSTGGVAAATTLSVPGDLFYPIKIAVEDARLDRADDAVARSELLLDFASSRMAEAERAAVADRQDSAAEALVAADLALREAAGVLIREYQRSGERGSLRPLEQLADASRSRLETLRAAVEGPAAVALSDLEVSFDRITQRIAAVTGDCCPASGSAQPGTPQLGEAFDFSYIPSADESFDACPCPPAGQQGTPAPATDAEEPAPTTEATTPPATEPPAEPDPAPQPPAATEPPPPEDERPVPLPEPVEDVVDPIEDIIDQVIEPLPLPEDPLAPLDEVLEGVQDGSPLPLPRRQ
jgi:hypothetical protein